ncbi:hypothetical protein [Mycobacterium sp.]|uniref:hypothetical protein n=1 Tax=Mycobacterium sp. TaxID=1785 RepID=UPI003C791004
MTRPILMLPRCAAVLFIAATAFSLGNPAASATNGATVVPLRGVLRACDFSPIYGGAPQNNASASSVIRVAGGTVAAEVHLSNPGSVSTHYDVSLIQAPRASNSPCRTAGPGVAVGGLDLDPGGQATTTVADSIRSGTTGVWVFIQRPAEFSQTPAEFYTSDFVAPV